VGVDISVPTRHASPHGRVQEGWQMRATPAHRAQINAVLAPAHRLPTARHVPDAKVLEASDKTQI